MKQNKKILIQIPLNSVNQKKDKVVLALGPELKANYCLIKNRTAFLYTGFEDLKRSKSAKIYKSSVRAELRKLKSKPKIIAHDLNPVFLSSRLAQELKDKGPLATSRIMPVQHHFAHISAGLASLGLLNKRIIGVACDGTGLGDNGKVWGCEFICYDKDSMQRVGQLNDIALPGADKAVLEPWRVATAMLFKVYQKDLFKLKIPFLNKKRYKVSILIDMIKKNINTPLASSAGRLFDAVSSLCGLVHEVKYEAQAAIALEQEAQKVIDKEKGVYSFSIDTKHGVFIINTDKMIKQIAKDVCVKTQSKVIAARFHNTFSSMLIAMCKKIRKRNKINDVMLTGGVFFNKIISKQVERGLRDNGFMVHRPGLTFLGDTGLSLGQAVIALQVMSKE